MTTRNERSLPTATEDAELVVVSSALEDRGIRWRGSGWRWVQREDVHLTVIRNGRTQYVLEAKLGEELARFRCSYPGCEGYALLSTRAEPRCRKHPGPHSEERRQAISAGQRKPKTRAAASKRLKAIRQRERDELAQAGAVLLKEGLAKRGIEYTSGLKWATAGGVIRAPVFIGPRGALYVRSQAALDEALKPFRCKGAGDCPHYALLSKDQLCRAHAMSRAIGLLQARIRKETTKKGVVGGLVGKFDATLRGGITAVEFDRLGGTLYVFMSGEGPGIVRRLVSAREVQRSAPDRDNARRRLNEHLAVLNGNASRFGGRGQRALTNEEYTLASGLRADDRPAWGWRNLATHINRLRIVENRARAARGEQPLAEVSHMAVSREFERRAASGVTGPGTA